MPLPTFLVIGAAKAGTSSVYAYLRQHPDIYMSHQKEPLFFADDWDGGGGPGKQERVRDREAYEALFERGVGCRATGEASPQYLYSSTAAPRIREALPDARLVVVLRDPAERAFSAWLHLARDGMEAGSFEDALRAEPQRVAERWDPIFHLRSVGFYARQLGRYLEVFDRSRLEILLYEELEDDPAGVMRRIFAFVGVDPDVDVDVSLRFNPGGLPRSRWLHEVTTTDNRARSMLKGLVPASMRERIRVSVINRNLERPSMSPALRAQLVEGYRSDLDALEELVDRDLSRWKR